jgi:hypothetical protein
MSVYTVGQSYLPCYRGIRITYLPTYRVPTRAPPSHHRHSSYGGYTWNRDLIPDPSAFTQKLHEHRLRLLVNTHDYTGVDACQVSHIRNVLEGVCLFLLVFVFV